MWIRTPKNLINLDKIKCIKLNTANISPELSFVYKEGDYMDKAINVAYSDCQSAQKELDNIVAAMKEDCKVYDLR